MIKITRLFLGVLALVSTQQVAAETLVLGSLENDIRRQVSGFAPLAQFLENHLIPYGIDDVQITVMREDQDMASALRDGKIDLYFDTPLIAAKVARDSGAIPLMRQFREGDATYRSVIVARRDGPVQTLPDLIGRKIAFDEKSSTSGFLVPAHLLFKDGVEITKLRGRNRKVPPGKAGYIFTQDRSNTMYWLVREWVDAGALTDREFAHLNAVYPNEFHVIAEGVQIPRAVVMARPGMSSDMTEAIVATLTTMHHSKEGRSAIKAFFDTDRFVAFPKGHVTFDPLFAILNRLTRIGII